jgi:hypothetical protein
MPRRQRPGYTSLRIEMPTEIVDALKADADRREESDYTWVTLACAKRLGIKWTPPPRGRPPKSKDEEKPRAKK